MVRALFFLSILLVAGCSNGRETNPLRDVEKWTILLSYNPSKHPVSPSDLHCFEMAIFDPSDHPPLQWLPKGAIPIAYVSVGEAEIYRDYWPRVREEAWILDPNPNWPKSRVVDIRSAQWRELLIGEVIPQAIEGGFVGLMLDTVDTVGKLMRQHPEDADVYREAMVSLIAEIHDTFPDLYLLTNGGFAILDEIAPYLDGVVVEDITFMPNFKKGGYMRTPEEWSSAKIAALRPLVEGYRIPVFSIDYVDGSDEQAIDEAIDRSRQLGYTPYLAGKELNQIYHYGEQSCD